MCAKLVDTYMQVVMQQMGGEPGMGGEPIENDLFLTLYN